MKKARILALLGAITLLWGCAAEPADTTAPAFTPSMETAATTQPQAADNPPSDFFSQRDLAGTYDSAAAAVIRLDGTGAVCDSDAVMITGSSVTITDEGTYILTGNQKNGTVTVNAAKEDKVQLVLQDAAIHCEDFAALYILQADKVFLTLAEGTQNALSCGEGFQQIDDSNVDAAIFSKEDLTVNGSGSLSVNSPAGHGIVSKDELTVTGGNFEISSANHGMAGKDSICIADGAFTITSGKDGLHAENSDDAQLGYLYIVNGSFSVNSEGDGISASSWMQIERGGYTLLCGGGSENATQKVSDNWGMGPGGMGGGMRPGGMVRPGGMGDGMGFGSTDFGAAEEEDSTSCKALKAATTLVVNGGSFSINAADDAFHSNGTLTVNGGSFSIATGDDGFHADEALTVNGGSITVTESYEGLEGLSVSVNGGNIHLTASDDGINAAGGADQSGFGGHRGGDMFGGSGTSDSFIHIAGGDIYMNASGDGIDSNGTLEISGGCVTVCGPTQGDTAVLDYELTGVITGGSFFGTGSYMMAQTFSDSEQGVIALSVGNQTAGTQIQLKDQKGNTLASMTPELPFAILIISTPEMNKGETYFVSVGEASGEFEAG